MTGGALARPAVAALSAPLDAAIKNPAVLPSASDAVRAERFVPGSNGKLIVLLRDAHANLSAQKNVYKAAEFWAKETGIDLSGEVTVEELQKKADELHIKYEKNYGKGRMIDTVYKKTVRQKLIQPCFLVGHPLEVSPLAKTDPNNPKRTLRFQPIAGKSELGNGFAELNDAIDQRKRFEEQMKLREAGDVEGMMLDEDFIQALEYGMPPACGFGMSERLFAVLMGRSVRETVIFPPMKGKE